MEQRAGNSDGASHRSRLDRTGATATRMLITGGTRSGKSGWAEQQLASCPSVLYVATGPEPTDQDDPAWAARVHKHRLRRPAGWRTWPTLDLVAGLRRAGEENCPVLIDDLGCWVTATLDATQGWTADPTSYRRRVADLVAAWSAFTGHAVLVSSEVGSSVHPDSASGRMFADELGQLTTTLAESSTDVVLVVAGLPLWLKSADLSSAGAHQ